MSDRTAVIYDLETGVRSRVSRTIQYIDLFMDGESGTWRLFLKESDDPPVMRKVLSYSTMDTRPVECVDFSLDGLIEFHRQLTTVLAQIESDPDSFNAEVRKSWDES